MKIAFIGQKGIPVTIGGIERYVENVAIRLAKRGHEIIVYTRPYYTDKKLSEYHGVRLVSLPTIKTKHLDAILHSLLATLHALFIARTETIHYVNIGPGFWAWLPRITKPWIKVISKFESIDWQHQKWGNFAKMSLKLGAWSMCHFSHKVFVTSKEIQTYVRQHYKVDAEVITNGFSLQKPLVQKQMIQALQKLNLEEDQFLLSASRLIKHKGIHYLIV